MKDSIIAVKIIRRNLRNPSIKISYIINSFFNARKTNNKYFNYVLSKEIMKSKKLDGKFVGNFFKFLYIII